MCLRHGIQRGVQLPEALKSEQKQSFGVRAVGALADSAVPGALQKLSGDVKLKST